MAGAGKELFEIDAPNNKVLRTFGLGMDLASVHATDGAVSVTGSDDTLFRLKL